MNAKKYIKKCPKCGTEIEPQRCASAGDNALGGVAAASAAAIGFALGGPVGGVIGAAVGFFGGRASVMGIENDHDENHLFRYVCPKCGCNWKEKIHTNDHPDDSSHILTGSPF